MNTANTRSKKHARSDDAEAFPRPFGNYILLMAFARGGMGEVYLAKRGAILGAEKYCVLKKLRPELTEDREYVARFIDEARVVVQLNHANICQVFDVGRVGSEYYLAMEYVSGRDVRSVQDRARNLGMKVHEASVLYLLAETLSALDYAHRRTHPMTGEPLNLVHRDVSPQNIMVSFEGEVKLIDFGLASSRLKVERTQPNIVMGKMAYMAPEQARGDAIDKRADLFAAGVVGYELLAGERFYEGMSSQEIWYVVGRGGFVPSRWTDLNPDFARILAKALHPDPDSRFSTCAEFRDAVMAYLHTKHPGLGERSLRELVQELYAEEILRERDMLLGFAEVSGEVVEDMLEATRSQSVSLAHAGDLPRSSGGGARVVHDERTQAGGALSAEQPSTQLTNELADTGSEEGPPPDLHTQLDDAGAPEAAPDAPRTPATGTITSGLAAEIEATRLGDPVTTTTHLAGGESVEQTAVVVRAPFDAARTVAAPIGESRPSARLVAAAAGILVVAIVAGFALFAGGDDEASDTSATVASVTAASTPPAAPTAPDAPPDEAPPDEALRDEPPEERASDTPPEQPAVDAPEVPPTAATPSSTAEAKADTDARSDDDDAEQRAAEIRRAREAKRLAALKAKEEREASRRAAAEKAAKEKEARRAQAARAQQRAPRESIEQMVYAIMKCDLGPPCAKSGFGGPILKYKAGSMDPAEKKSFETLVRQCRKRCTR